MKKHVDRVGRVWRNFSYTMGLRASVTADGAFFMPASGWIIL
jgi:hypothetical protein